MSKSKRKRFKSFIGGARPKPVERVKVLAAVKYLPDRSEVFLEIRGPKHLDAYVAQLLLSDTADGEILAERIAELQAPRCYQPLFDPNAIRQTALLLPRTVEEEQYRSWQADMVRTLTRVGRDLRGGKEAKPSCRKK